MVAIGLKNVSIYLYFFFSTIFFSISHIEVYFTNFFFFWNKNKTGYDAWSGEEDDNFSRENTTDPGWSDDEDDRAAFLAKAILEDKKKTTPFSPRT